MNKPLFALLLASVSLTAFSLGLGNITISSKLNEPFKAEIPLLDTKGINITGIKVDFAPLKYFQKAGLERDDEVLSQLKFVITKNKANQNIISIQSIERISAPYFEMMLDLTWPEGQFYREYVVLLDPPDYHMANQSGQLKGNFLVKNSTNNKRGVANRSSYTHLVHHQVGSTKYSPSSKDRVYGPTLINEDIWQIAQRFTSADITLPQVILSIVGTNAKAFTQGNLNGLKVGVKLSIPNAETMSQIPANLAKQEVEAHDSAWKSNKEIQHVILPPYFDAIKGTTQFDNQITSIQSTDSPRVAEREPELDYKMLSYIPAVSSAKAFKSVLTSNIAAIENEKLKQQLKELVGANAQLQRLLSEQNAKIKALQASVKQVTESEKKQKKQSDTGEIWSYFWLILTLGSILLLAYQLYINKASDDADEEFDESSSLPPDVPLTQGLKDSEYLVTGAEQLPTAESVAGNALLENNSSQEKPEPLLEDHSQEHSTQEPDIAPFDKSRSEDNKEIEDNASFTAAAELPSDLTKPKSRNQFKDDNMIEFEYDDIPSSKDNAAVSSDNKEQLFSLEDDKVDSDSSSNNGSLDFDESPDDAEDFEEPTDPIETQLDLAKTYIAMDDLASAVEYLEEVVSKGTSTQQAEANQLLAKINQSN